MNEAEVRDGDDYGPVDPYGNPLYQMRGGLVEHDVTVRGHWRRVYDFDPDTDDHARFRYYWRGIRVPWLAWAMFS